MVYDFQPSGRRPDHYKEGKNTSGGSALQRVLSLVVGSGPRVSLKKLTRPKLVTACEWVPSLLHGTRLSVTKAQEEEGFVTISEYEVVF